MAGGGEKRTARPSPTRGSSRRLLRRGSEPDETQTAGSARREREIVRRASEQPSPGKALPGRGLCGAARVRC